MSGDTRDPIAEAFENLGAWMASEGVNERELFDQIGYEDPRRTTTPDPKTALATLVRLCDAAPDEHILGALTVQHIEALVDMQWREIRPELEGAYRTSERFREACRGAVLNDDVSDDLANLLAGKRVR